MRVDVTCCLDIAVSELPQDHICTAFSHPFSCGGGVKISEFADYINAGACGFGIGGALGYKEAVLSDDYSIITKCAKEHREAFNKAKMQQYAFTDH